MMAAPLSPRTPSSTSCRNVNSTVSSPTIPFIGDRMLHRAIITLVVTLLVPVCAQDFVLQPGQVLPLTFTVPENATATDQRISVTAGPGTDASIRCTPTSVTNGTWFWESSTYW